MARTAVVAGTATAVVGGVQHRQQARAAQAADAQAYQDAAAPLRSPSSGGPAGGRRPIRSPSSSAWPTLKAQGILTDEEFTAAKAKLLGI